MGSHKIVYENCGIAGVLNVHDINSRKFPRHFWPTLQSPYVVISNSCMFILISELAVTGFRVSFSGGW